MRKLNAEISSRVNRSIVLAQIHRNPLISRVELADLTGLDRSAVTHILNDLLAEGLVEEVRKGEAGKRGGRRPILLQVLYQARTLLAVEVGLTHAQGAIAGLNGEILHRISCPVDRSEPLLDLLRRILESLRAESPQLFEKACIIGVSTPGVVDAEKGEMIVNRYHHWRNVPVVEQLSKEYHMAAFVENDANAAALGELHDQEEQRPINSLIYLFLRESHPGSDNPLGVGGAVIFNGQLWRGSRFYAGEASETINESFLSIMRRLKSGRPDLHDASLSTLIQHAASEDADAMWAIREIAEQIGALLGQLATFLDPEGVLVAIQPPEGKDLFIDEVDSAFRDQYRPVNEAAMAVLRSKLGKDATLTGLLRLALEQVFIRDTSHSSILIP